ncbi:MAG: hypothetical protein QG594_787 [Bacteroidota bacterium]|nr:hypothetical protein [Bacteroidota bacterium]
MKMTPLTQEIKQELDRLLQNAQNVENVDALLTKLKEEFESIKLKNIFDESIENLTLQLETLDAKIDYVKENISKSAFIKNDPVVRKQFIDNLKKIQKIENNIDSNKDNNNIELKLKKLEKLTHLKKEIDAILLTASNIPLDKPRPKDYPTLKLTFDTLKELYFQLNIRYKDIPLSKKLTSTI